jgi:hypothetical protein
MARPFPFLVKRCGTRPPPTVDLTKGTTMDYVALKLSEQLMAQRRAEARRHNLSKLASAQRASTPRRPGVGRLLELIVRPARTQRRSA